MQFISVLAQALIWLLGCLLAFNAIVAARSTAFGRERVTAYACGFAGVLSAIVFFAWPASRAFALVAADILALIAVFARTTTYPSSNGEAE